MRFAFAWIHSSQQENGSSENCISSSWSNIENASFAAYTDKWFALLQGIGKWIEERPIFSFFLFFLKIIIQKVNNSIRKNLALFHTQFDYFRRLLEHQMHTRIDPTPFLFSRPLSLFPLIVCYKRKFQVIYSCIQLLVIDINKMWIQCKSFIKIHIFY